MLDYSNMVIAPNSGQRGRSESVSILPDQRKEIGPSHLLSKPEAIAHSWRRNSVPTLSSELEPRKASYKGYCSANPYRSKSRSRSAIISAITTIVLVGIMYFLGSRSVSQLERELEEAESIRDELFENQENLLLELAKDRRLPKENRDLVQHVRVLKEELDQKTHDLEEEIQRRNEAQSERIDCWTQYERYTSSLRGEAKLLTDDLSKMTRTLALERFGFGPHFVQFELKIWNGMQSERAFFTVETAPVSLMPATIFMFLEQVDLGLWDSTSFFFNAPHILMAQPLSGDGNVMRLPQMEALGLAHIPFQEFSPEFPHKPYTLGFGGLKQPGPFFYVNKIDNSRNQVGEPCFAKIVIGKEIIDRISEIHKPKDPYYIQPVDIVTVRILDDLSMAASEKSEVLSSDVSGLPRKQDGL